MEDQDKLFEQFRASAEKAEQKGFDRMEALWNRVEDKLDKEEQRKSATWWKYTGMAAVVVLFITVGTFLYRESKPGITPQGTQENQVTVIDTQRIMKTFEPSKENVAGNAAVVTTDAANGNAKAPKGLTYDTLYPGRLSERALPGQIAAQQDKNSPVADYYANSRSYSAEAASDSDRTITFSGIVTDDKGMPLPGAMIRSEDGTSTALSDINGRYTITAVEGDKVTASYIGMKSGHILAYKANDNRNVALAEDTQALSSITTEGPRADSRSKYTALKDLTPEQVENPNNGSMPSVNGTVAEIDEGKVRKREQQVKRPDNAVANNYANGLTAHKEQVSRYNNSVQLKQAPGANPVYDSLVSNQFPDDAITGGDPLYIIDGIVSSEEAFRKTDAKDIVSITVLKDSSATSIYGNRAKSGVIMIKTKKSLTAEELKKLERDMKRSYKETKKKLKAATKP